ncbi:MAG: hypothetical protein CMJ18_23340 [Phycisphaeraceae bacterium]|nr:hypothetical protein [Phycisphaeraceae bacterium]
MTSRRPFSIDKWLLAAGFWCAQWAFITGMIALLLNGNEEISVDAALDMVTNTTYLRDVTLYLVVPLSAAQAAFLLPALPPRAHRSRRVRWGTAIVAGLALGWVTAWAVILIGILFAHFSPGTFSDPDTPLIFWIALAIAWPIATCVIAVNSKDGMPVWVSATLTAVCAVVLTAGLVGALVSLAQLTVGASDKAIEIVFWSCATALIPGWIAATCVFVDIWRRRPTNGVLARAASLIFAGTAIETIAMIPVDVLVRRKTDCYCSDGTFFTLIACLGTGTFIFGPMMLILPFARRQRRRREGRCAACGYDLRGSGGASTCPECGTADRH